MGKSRWGLWCALWVACGSGGSEGSGPDSGPDAAPVQQGDGDGPDSGQDPVTSDAGSGREDGGGSEPQVTTAGEPCADNASCDGPGATCLGSQEVPGLNGGEAITLGFPDGYCTAMCTTSEQCGPGAKCAVTELVDAIRPLATLAGYELPDVMIPSFCLQSCRRAADCREGYVCQGLLAALPLDMLLEGASAQPGGNLLGNLPGLSRLGGQYCLPPAPDLDLNASSRPTRPSAEQVRP